MSSSNSSDKLLETQKLQSQPTKALTPTQSSNYTVNSSNSRPPTTMNTRAPTNLHDRLSFEDRLPGGSGTQKDVPEDEDMNRMGGSRSRPVVLSPPEWMTSSSSGTKSASYPTRNVGDDFIGDYTEKRRSDLKVHSGVASFNSVSNVPQNVVSTSASHKLTTLDKEDLSESEDDENQNEFTNLHQSHPDIVKPVRGGTTSRTAPAFADFNSRWSSTQEDPMEAERAHNRAVSLAAKRLAESKFQREEEEWFEEEEKRRLSQKVHSSPTSQSRLPKASVLSTFATRARESVTSIISPSRNVETEEQEQLMQMTQHERIRAEALKMLQLADLTDVSAPTHGINSSTQVSTSAPTASTTHSLFRTSSGGFSSSFGGGGVSSSSISSTASSRNVASIIGLGSDTNRSKSPMASAIGGKKSFMDRRFSIQEDAEDDDNVVIIEELDAKRSHFSYTDVEKGKEGGYSDKARARDRSPLKATSTSGDESSKSWSSRYSVDRHFMALNAGMSSKQVQSKLDQDHYNSTYKNTSATNMFKTSPHDQQVPPTFGSQSDQNDYWFKTHRSLRNTIGSIPTFVSSLIPNLNSMNRKRGKSSRPTSPNSTSSPNSWTRDINLVDPNKELPTIPFSPYDDYEIDRQKKRRFRTVSLVLILVAALLGIILTMTHSTVSKRNEDSSNAIVSSFWNVGASVNFYVTSDIPFSISDENTLNRQLSNLDASSENAASFLVHLGNVGLAANTLCSSTMYTNVASILKSSPIPVFVIPGDNDWNDCPDPSTALDNWREYLGDFALRHTFKSGHLPDDMAKQLSRSENFSFLFNGVLFIGINVVSGTEQDSRELETRTLHNIQWVTQTLSNDMYRSSDYRTVVILGHAPVNEDNGRLFWVISDSVADLNKPVLYIHSNDGSGDWKRYKPFPEISPQFEAVMLQRGGLARPVKVSVGKGSDIFSFTR